MALRVERRQGDRRRRRGPGMVNVLRSQLVERQMELQVEWAEVAEAAEQIARFARARQRKAWERTRSWDGAR